MKTAILFLFFAFLSVSAFAQSTPKWIAGTVKDTNNEVIPGATVRLLRATDSSLVAGEISDRNGQFQLNIAANGDYLLAITAMGQKPFTSAALPIDDSQSSIVLPVIILLPAKSIELKEVVITSKKALIEQEMDRTIINVEAMISSATSNTLEVLEKTPGVTVDNNGEISLNGRAGVLVLIDGKSTYLSGQDLAAYLKSLPGGVLDKLELMDNPPAKYDAAGNAIINIRLKKNRTGGFTGNVSLGASVGRHARNNDAINLNYNHKKLNLFANLGYNYEKYYTLENYDRRFYNAASELSSTVALENHQTYKNRGINTNFGMDYAATPKTTYGLVVNMNSSRGNGLFTYESNRYNARRQPEAAGTGSTAGSDTRTNLGTNINLLHKFNGKGRELSADANYLRYGFKGYQAFQNFSYEPTGELSTRNEFLYNIPSSITIYTAKADYVHPLKNKARLEAGFKSSVVDNENVSGYFDIVESVSLPDRSKSNHFKYHENINAAYITSQKSWKSVGVQLGLRAENTQANGQQLSNAEVPSVETPSVDAPGVETPGSRFTKSYTSLFPSAFVSYKLDSLNKNTLSVMAVRRINRPNYQSLNPFLFFRDQYSYHSGNPLLNPQYQSRVEVKYQHKQLLNMGLSYNKFSDVIFQTTEAVGNIFITKPKNIAGGFMLLLNTTLTVSPAKWWDLNTTLRLSHMGIRGKVYTENLDFTTNIARLEMNNYFSISKSWTADLGGYYASSDLNGQAVTSGMYRVNGSVQKKIWQGKGSIRLGFDDLFHSWVYYRKSISLKQAVFYQTSESDTQRVSFALTYRFGKETFARKRRHANNAAEEEKGRIDF